MTVDGAVKGPIREWLMANATGGRPVSDDQQLIRDGLLTSLMVVELVLFLEQQFGVVIDDMDVSEENFASVQAIAELVDRKRA
ncbi:acyl carrier protein [Sphaerobacter sp.]|uniref:acyl carrier protein n=1 Tax=Sphaerobacter sp. TaxID=2099654 RepID=UPI001D59DDAD|nr:acyl carrier protein [Sphaerobacter sp.]MBX5446552.1 acyl carrier protein [Sphaerobacter sp.]